MVGNVGIVGGGPGGLMLARLLSQRGVTVTVLERDAHDGERPQGGSLDLHDDTGQRAMRSAALERAFDAVARPEDQGDRLYDAAGQLLFEHDGQGGNRPEIDRGDLRRILLAALPAGVVRWGCRVEGVQRDGDRLHVLTGADAAEGCGPFDLVVGADGVWSRVRPVVTGMRPVYEGVTFLELGFDAARHPHAAELAGSGKAFAVGENRALILQRNGHGHIRFYAGLRLAEDESLDLARSGPERARTRMADAFATWAPALRRLIDEGDFIAVRPLHAMPIGARWDTRAGVTLMGDAAHVMSPFSGQGVNLALADALDLADAITDGLSGDGLAGYEARMMARADSAATAAAAGLAAAFSREGAAPVLAHYRRRVSGG